MKRTLRRISRMFPRFVAGACVGVVSATGCHHGASSQSSPPPMNVVATSVQTRFETRDHLIAAVEMQLSGEPLAEAMGRDLSGYNREALPPNQYFFTTLGSTALQSELDLVGFSTAVESYEYSKQPMNNLAFESGAGLSLMAGPVLNPQALTGAAGLRVLEQQVQTFGFESLATNIVTFDADLGSAWNPLGWPGLWPIVHPYESFDPAIAPASTDNLLCSFSTDDTPGGVLLLDYECDATTLHLQNRAAQISPVITPGSSGWAGWKNALWAINYLQVMHDSLQNQIAAVPADELALVGQPGNLVSGTPAQAGASVVPGVYLGSSDIEGFQAGLLISELDNQFQSWLTTFTTLDGATLSGFPSLMDALTYDDETPLRWIPGDIAVAEAPDPDATQPFPLPAGYAIQSPDSTLIDLLGLLGAASEAYALTDASNPSIGGTQPALAWFDGDPFPADNGVLDGQPTLHDRSAALLRVLTVNLDRVHRDPASGVLVDTAAFQNGTLTPAQTVETSSLAYALVALRTARNALGSNLSLYGSTTPDQPLVQCPLDAFALSGAPGGEFFSQRLDTLVATQAQLFLSGLTQADGMAFDGWNVAEGGPLDTSDTLDAHAAAIRGLLQAYLATGETAYRTRAIAVFNRMDSVFFHPGGRVYLPTPWQTAPLSFAYTPRRFGMLQGALRDLYELVGATPGQEALGTLLQQRLARMNKLILNGWDDRNQDGLVDWPEECINVSGGVPRGGLQMAERALSGETGAVDDQFIEVLQRAPTVDREKDCVPDIWAAQLPAALADELDLMLVPQGGG